MQNKKNRKDYRSYSFEDFLQDEFFISSMNNPTEDTVAFWESFKKKNSQNLFDYNSAKLYIEKQPVPEDSLSDEEVVEMWDSINERNALNLRMRSRRMYMVVGSIAASIVILIGVFSYNTYYSKYDIYEYASQSQLRNSDSSDAELILSENKVVVIHDKESKVTYESSSVKVKDENISKDGIATYNTLRVPRGKRSILTFSEGTKVWVNAGTRVIYPSEFNSKEREIYVDGEIYIEVAPDKNWPFIVKTKDMGVTVLGTAFNVTAYETDPLKRIVLVSGSVKIENKRNKNEGILLSPNKMYEDEHGKDKIVNVDVYRYTSWKDGVYLFENEKLEAILSRLSRYYGEDIFYDDIAANLKCSGKLDLKNNLKEVLSGLSYTAPVVFKDENGIYAVKYNPESGF